VEGLAGSETIDKAATHMPTRAADVANLELSAYVSAYTHGKRDPSFRRGFHLFREFASGGELASAATSRIAGADQTAQTIWIDCVN
jgi:hypothetical protein